jgi:hypothetical protein
MIEKKFAASQIDRLSGLDWFPREKGPALSELIRAMQTAPNEVAAEFIITELVRDARECPKPSDLYRMCGNEREKIETQSDGCELCGGTGMVIVEFSGYTGAKDCECRRLRLSA